MENNTSTNTKKITYVGIILIVFVMIISVSFAYFTVNPDILGNISGVEGTAKNDTPVITFVEDKSGVTLTNTYPMTDEVAIKNVDAYKFTVRNDETEKDLAITVVLEVTSGSTLDDTLVNLLLDKSLMTLGDLKQLTPSSTSFRNTYVINEFILAPGETKSSSLQIWINENGTVENAQNKTWSSKLMVIPEFAENAKTYKFNAIDAVTAIANGKTPYAINVGKPDFSEIATTDEGIYAMEDNYGTSYYYRGAVENNYVRFAGFYWRIVRINGDGSMRIIYDGTSAHKNGEASTDRVTGLNIRWHPFTNFDSKYLGYMFGGADGENSLSKVGAQTNDTNTYMKTTLESWYTANIEEKGFSKYIADVIFCNDRTTATQDGVWSNNDTALGYGGSENITFYGGRYRLYNNRNNPLTTFICPENDTIKYNNDWFTVQSTDENKGNGYLSKPIGLLTADEASAAGAYISVNENTEANNYAYYLYKGDYWYWLMTPRSNNGSYLYMSTIGASGKIGIANIRFIDETEKGAGVAPVINLSAETVKTLVGNGTIGNEFRLPLN